MLVLTRKLNQQIQLGDNIKITVLRVKGNTIRLGIDAPRDVRVVRGELDPLPSERSTVDTVFAAVSEDGGQAHSGAKAPAAKAAKDAVPGHAVRTSPAGRSDGVRVGSPLKAFLPAVQTSALQTPGLQTSAAQLSA